MTDDEPSCSDGFGQMMQMVSSQASGAEAGWLLRLFLRELADDPPASWSNMCVFISVYLQAGYHSLKTPRK